MLLGRFNMALSEFFKEQIDKGEQLKGFNKESFFKVLDLIDKNRKYCIENKLNPKNEESIKLMKYDIITEEMSQLETVSRFEMWNATVYEPRADKNETEFTYQFCSAPPDCTRIFITFNQEGNPQLKIANPCVVLNPDLSKVHAFYGGANQNEKPEKQQEINLKDTIEQFNQMGLQRVGIVGFARNLPDFIKEEDLKSTGLQSMKAKLRDQQRAAYASLSVDAFLTELEKKKVAFTTVNGGWAGQNQKIREVGMTFMGHLYGLVHDYDSSGGGFFPPITVMPEGGSSDSVTTSSKTEKFLDKKLQKRLVNRYQQDLDVVREAFDISQENKKPIQVLKPEEVQSSRTQFIVEGVDWGEDSPYLASMCTSMIVLEPAGRWTQIEMLNGLVRGIPVAIIASPENYRNDWLQDNKIDPLYKGLNEGKKYITVPFPTNSNPHERVRAYRDPADAAKWIAWRYQVDHHLKDSPETQQFLNNEENQKKIYENYQKINIKKIHDPEKLLGALLEGIKVDNLVDEYLKNKVTNLKKADILQLIVSPDSEETNKRSMFNNNKSTFFKLMTQYEQLEPVKQELTIEVEKEEINPIQKQ